MFATHPLIIMEGLLNLHNDLIGVCLAIIGFYYLLKNKNIQARLLLTASFGIKYLTLPFLFISKKIHNRVSGFYCFFLLFGISYFSK